MGFFDICNVCMDSFFGSLGALTGVGGELDGFSTSFDGHILGSFICKSVSFGTFVGGDTGTDSFWGVGTSFGQARQRSRSCDTMCHGENVGGPPRASFPRRTGAT
ncbi:hypothetical protein DVH05_024363 [Phytophthora capsici]|nr:hypothetical protein DVH05_024363 [Phytophthora capsici]